MSRRLNWSRARSRPSVDMDAEDALSQHAGKALGERQRPKRWDRLADFGPSLSGLGGMQTAAVRALKGATFGPASPGRSLSDDERRVIEDQMRRDGRLAVPS